MNRIFLATVFLLVLLVMAFSLLKSKSDERTESEHALKTKEVNTAKSARESHTNIAKLLEAVSAQIERFAFEERQNENLSSLQIIKKEFIILDALKGAINKHEQRKKKLAELIKDPRNIAIAKKALEDLDWVIENFGDEQAIARIFSIEILKAHAAKGNKDELYSAIATLSDQLRHDKSQWKKGREYDLRDLVGAAMELEGREYILRNSRAFLENTYYSSNLQKIYSLAVVSYLYKDYFDEEVNQAFLPHWQDDIFRDNNI